MKFFTYFSTLHQFHNEAIVAFIFIVVNHFHNIRMVYLLHDSDLFTDSINISLRHFTPRNSGYTCFITYFERILIATRSLVSLFLPLRTVAKLPLRKN